VNEDHDPLALSLTCPSLLDEILILPLELPAPPVDAPLVAGADPISDIWNWVNNLFWQIAGAPYRFTTWLWDLIQSTIRTIWDGVNWLWNSAVSPAFWNLITWINDRLGWLWDAFINPGLHWVYDRIWGTAQWFWDTGIRPAFDWTYGFIESKVNWLWNSAVRPAFDWTWGFITGTVDYLWNARIAPSLQWLWSRVNDVWQWFWDTALHPAILWLETRIWDAARWLLDNIVSPSLDWLQDRLDQIRDLAQGAKDVVVNQVWPAVQSIPEQVINVGIAGAQAIGEGFRDALQWLFEHVFDPVADAIGVKMGIPRKLLTGQYHSIEDLLNDVEDPFGTSSIAGLLWAIPAATLGLIPAMLEMGSIIFRGDIYRMARELGPTIPTFADLRDGLLRGLLPENDHDWWLGAAGFSADNISMIKQLYFDIPTPSDLVRMAVREAFTPNVVEQFGLHEDFPPDFDTYARQIGIDHNWALAHWAAHWDLPSATQGFDMFHRALDAPAAGTEAAAFSIGGETYYSVISSDTLQLLLRTLDYMPFWRPKLTAIAYRPVSRIDIRRMFAVGAADRRDVLRTYLSLGYTPDDALKLTDFVTRDAAAVSKDVPRETIVNFYRDGILTRPEAASELTALGFDDETADMLLDQADLAIQDQLAKLAEDVFETDYKAGRISEQELRNDLAFIGVPAARIDLLVQLWTRQTAVKPYKLTVAQVQRLYREGVIGEAQATYILSSLGCSTDITGWLLQLATPEPDLPPARELSKEDLKGLLTHNLLQEGEVRARMLTMGWKSGDVDLLLQLWTPEPKEVNLTKADLKAALRAGTLSESQVRDQLLQLGYDATEADTYLTIWAETAQTVDLTRADLRAAFRAGLMDETTVKNALLARGYDATEAAILIDTWRPAPTAV
jgi:hypothetical protein